MMKFSTKILLTIQILLTIALFLPFGVQIDAKEKIPDTVITTSSSEEITPQEPTLNTLEDATASSTEGTQEETDEPKEVKVEEVNLPEKAEITPEKTTVAPVTVPKKSTSNSNYYIKVNRTQNVVNIYTRDESGEYTIPYKAFLCSIGTATPVAGKTYKTTTYKTRWNGLVGNVYGQYITQIIGDILFHSVPYTKKDVSTLEYWEFDKLGEEASAGCVRLTVEGAKWIYDNIEAGTIVEFYEDDNPGPFGKPTVPKISDNERCRDWDPTDPAEGNPWNIPEEPIPEEIVPEEIVPEAQYIENTETPSVEPTTDDVVTDITI